MGLLDDAQRQAEKVVRLHRTKATRSEVRSSETTDKLLKELPYMVRARVARPAIRAASKIVRKRIRKNLNATGRRTENPDGTVVRGQPIGRSKKTGTGEKLSRKLKAKRKDNKEMSKAIITRNWTKNLGAVVGTTTGPSHKHAAQGHLLEYGANIYLWGNSKKRYQLPPRPFMRNAVTETRGLQKMVIINTMKKWARKVRSEITKYPDIDDS